MTPRVRNHGAGVIVGQLLEDGLIESIQGGVEFGKTEGVQTPEVPEAS